MIIQYHRYAYPKNKSFGIVLHYRFKSRPSETAYDARCETLEAALAKYKTDSIHEFHDGLAVEREGAFFCVPRAEVAAALKNLSEADLRAFKKAMGMSWVKFEQTYGFRPEWA